MTVWALVGPLPVYSAKIWTALREIVPAIDVLPSGEAMNPLFSPLLRVIAARWRNDEDPTGEPRIAFACR